MKIDQWNLFNNVAQNSKSSAWDWVNTYLSIISLKNWYVNRTKNNALNLASVQLGKKNRLFFFQWLTGKGSAWEYSVTNLKKYCKKLGMWLTFENSAQTIVSSLLSKILFEIWSVITLQECFRNFDHWSTSEDCAWNWVSNTPPDHFLVIYEYLTFKLFAENSVSK